MERGFGPGCERFGRDTGATSFTEVFQYSWPSEKPFEDVWREWVKKVSKLPQGSLSSQAIEQLTISGMARHGQPELENHQRLRAPMAWQDIGTPVEKYLSTIYHQQSPQPMDVGTATTNQKCQSCGSQTHKREECWHKDETRKTCGTRGHLVKVCRSGNTQKQSSGSSKGAGKGTGKGSGKGEGKGKSRASETCCGKDGHKKKNAACPNCGKIGHLRSVCRNTNTHEIEQETDEPSPEVSVEAVWCMIVQDTVEDDHYDHSEKFEECSEHREGHALKELSRTSRWIKNFGKVITNIGMDQNCEKVVERIEMDQHCGKFVANNVTDQNSRTFVEYVVTDQHSGKVVPKFAMDDSGSRQ